MANSPANGASSPVTSGPVGRPRTNPRRNLGLRVVLSLIPFFGTCAVIPLVNRVTPYVLGLPFLVFWIAACTVLTSVCMASVYLLDPTGRRARG